MTLEKTGEPVTTPIFVGRDYYGAEVRILAGFFPLLSHDVNIYLRNHDVNISGILNIIL